MKDMPYVFCGRREKHTAHGHTCPGTGRCGSREVHEPHLVTEGSLAPYWCFGDRIRLYRENHVTNDRRKLVATTWHTEPLPVMMPMGEDEPSGIVGTITGVHRERSTGWVTGLLTMHGRGVQPSGLAAEATFDQILGDPETEGLQGDVLVLVGPRLRGVTLGHRPTWDEMVIP